MMEHAALGTAGPLGRSAATTQRAPLAPADASGGDAGPLGRSAAAT